MDDGMKYLQELIEQLRKENKELKEKVSQLHDQWEQSITISNYYN